MDLNSYRPKVKEDYLVEGLDNIYIKFGRPKADVSSPVFWNMLGQIIQVWMKTYPQEFDDWMHDLKVDLAVERSIKESATKGIKKSIGFPQRLFQMVRLYFPDLKFNNKKFVQKCIKTFPMLHNSNYT